MITGLWNHFSHVICCNETCQAFRIIICNTIVGVKFFRCKILTSRRLVLAQNQIIRWWIYCVTNLGGLSSCLHISWISFSSSGTGGVWTAKARTKTLFLIWYLDSHSFINDSINCEETNHSVENMYTFYDLQVYQILDKYFAKMNN